MVFLTKLFTDGNLKFIFTKIDPKDPSREFYFVLKVISEGEVDVYKSKESLWIFKFVF